MGLQRLQERVLSEKAESSHRYIELLFVCATLGAWKRFHEIGRSLDGTAEEDLLAYRLLGIERAPEHAQWVTEHVQESRDTLLHYTLTKFYLGRNDITGALSVAKSRL